ncbi:MAG: GNAT family N-acetyltransferase [Actinobacteria bacterium]|nr:GNAT family N-acetyltransferase [Actinomycetota bacterium]
MLYLGRHSSPMRIETERLLAWTATVCRDEIGWAIDPARWGEGLATEAAAAAPRDTFERVRLERVVSFTSLANIASTRVMERLGLERGGTTEWAGSEHVWYTVSAQREHVSD